MNLISLISPIFIVILFGYIASRCNIMPKESNDILIKFVFLLAMPVQLLLDFSQTDINQVFNVKYILAYSTCTFLVGFTTFYISRKFLNYSISESSLNIMATAHVNTTYLAIPIFILVFDNIIPVIPIVLFQVIVLTSILLILIEYDKNNISNYSTSKQLYHIMLIPFKNPIIVSSFLGIVLSYYNLHIPVFLCKTFNILGQTASPLALFALGQSIHYDIKNLKKRDIWEINILSLIKLIFFPFLSYLIGKYVFRLENENLYFLIIIAAMPTPKNMYIFAMQYKLKTAKPASIVSLTTLLSLVTIPILIFLLPIVL